MSHLVTQSISDFAMTRPRYAFFDWQMKLKTKDKLPRGKWFQSKLAGRPIFVMDEAFFYMCSKKKYGTLKAL